MPKNKRPVPRKSAADPELKDEQLTQTLCELALALAEREDGEAMGAALREKDAEFHRLVRKLLNQHKDAVLYGAIDLAGDEDIGAWQLLRATVEEAAATVLLRRDGAPELEVNAFAIPLFAHSAGGLDPARAFQDDAAFEALLASFQSAGLEGPKAKVVLIRHAYDLDQVDAITYSHLHAMVREAAQSMTEKKLLPAPALERSMAAGAPAGFGPDDAAVELRFLLGFALKRSDDPFYQVPADEAGADAWFAARTLRYQEWTERYAPLVQRCLAGGGAAPALNFLYQDLFFGAKEQGIAEHAMLQLLATLNQTLARHGLAPDRAGAVIAPADVGGRMVLRVQLAGPDGAVLAEADKPLDLAADLGDEVEDLRDALASIGLRQLSVARQFGADGRPLAPLPL